MIYQYKKVVTFYSFKGGVGRSVTLANIAWLLATKFNKKVAMIDWDLEAPGLHRYFEIADNAIERGLIDLLNEFKRVLKNEIKDISDHIKIGDYLVNIPVPSDQGEGSIQILPAGKLDREFAGKVNEFNWTDFYERWKGFGILEYIKKELTSTVDYLLIDSRTGITDIGGICTKQLPDLVVLCFVYNKQNIFGIKYIADSILHSEGKAPDIILLPTKVEEQEELAIRQQWEEEAYAALSEFLPEDRRKPGYFIENKIQYIPYFSYGENIAVRLFPDYEISQNYLKVTESIIKSLQRDFPVTPTWVIRIINTAMNKGDEHIQIEQTSDNPKLEHFPIELLNFPLLKSLTIRNCSLKYFPEDISALFRLDTLMLCDNDIDDFSFLSQLKSLKSLNLKNNNLERLDTVNLPSLEVFDLSYNKITDVGFLSSLPQLKSLNLSFNKITDINAIANLVNLEHLDISNNQIAEVASLTTLTHLRRLDLSDNLIKDLQSLRNLFRIKEVNLSRNQITNISGIEQLKTLKKLDLSNNLVTDITPLKEAKNLDTLELQRNPIEFLPDWITTLDMDIQWDNIGFDEGYISLFDNPIKNIPPEIVVQGKEAIKKYFAEINEQGVEYIYEAKVIFVGDGGVGKTSLKNRLFREKYPRYIDETRGISITDWKFGDYKGKDLVAHIWDFGGQDVYYPVHRFFLTGNSVFVLMGSSRQASHNFDYWLPTISQFGDNCPVILVQNAVGGNAYKWNDLQHFLTNPNFNIIKTAELPYYELDVAKDSKSLETLKKDIVYQLNTLPNFGKAVPASWRRIKEEMSLLSKDEVFLSFDSFREIYRESDIRPVSNAVDIENCAAFLHSIGTVIWYSNNEYLRNWLILQPEWFIESFYKLIDDEEIAVKGGVIEYKDLDRVWQVEKKESKDLLIKLMEEFGIMLQEKTNKRFIIPARLLTMPAEQALKLAKNSVRVECRYDFMPKGIVNQLAVALGRHVTEGEIWSNAVNFRTEDRLTLCQAEEDFYNRNIILSAQGRDARDLLTTAMSSLKDINDRYKKLHVETYIGCTCKSCRSAAKPTLYLYEDLTRQLLKGRKTVFCNESAEELDIEDLLFNAGLATRTEKHKRKTDLRIIKVFMASSSDLSEDANQLDIFFSRENRKLASEGIFLNLVRWDSFIDVMSKSRMQDQFNSVISDCDIFIGLFFSKIGAYTREEFEFAFGNYKEKSKPLIFTYFKDQSISARELNWDILKVIEFKEKLKELGHFANTYKNIDDLKYQFSLQLERSLSSLL